MQKWYSRSHQRIACKFWSKVYLQRRNEKLGDDFKNITKDEYWIDINEKRGEDIISEDKNFKIKEIKNENKQLKEELTDLYHQLKLFSDNQQQLQKKFSLSENQFKLDLENIRKEKE